MLCSTYVVIAQLNVTSLCKVLFLPSYMKVALSVKLNVSVGLSQEAEKVRMTTGKSIEEASKLRDDADALAGRVAVTSKQVDNQEAVESSQRMLIDDVSSGY